MRKIETTRHLADHRPVLCFASPEATLSQLAIIRADLVKSPVSVCYVETAEYSSSGSSVVKGIDRLMRDIGARRVEEFEIDEARWGPRRIVINYFGR